MSYWILQSAFEPRSALQRISDLLKLTPDELCVELGLTHHQEKVHAGCKLDASNDFISKVESLQLREELESDLADLRDGKSMLRFLGEERVIAKQQKIKSSLASIPTRQDFIRWYYQHPRIWLLAFIRDAALDASRNSDAEWIQIEEHEDKIAPTALLLLKTEISLVKRYHLIFQSEWSKLSSEFILHHLDGHRSLKFDSDNKVVSYNESIPLPNNLTS